METTPTTLPGTMPRALAELAAPAVLSEELAEWLAALTDSTRLAYSKDLDLLGAWMHAGEYCGSASQVAALDALLAVGRINASRIARRWRDSMLGANLSPRTVCRRLAALRSALGMARATGLIEWKLEVQSPTTGKSENDMAGPSEASVGRMLSSTMAAAQSGKPKAVRDWAIISLLTMHGLRSIEVRRLLVSDFNPETGCLLIQGKGRTEREAIALVPQAVEAIAVWLELRGGGGGEALFVSVGRYGTLGSKMLSPGAFQLVTKGAATKAGEKVSKRAKRTERGEVRTGNPYNPHGLRHSAITRAARVTNGNFAEVAAFSRHKDLRTVRHYLDNQANLQSKTANAVATGWAV